MTLFEGDFLRISCPEIATVHDILWKKVKVWVAQLCLTLWDPTDCSPPGSSVHGILQARILEWVAIPFSRGSSQPRDRTQVSLIAGGFFTIWVIREAHVKPMVLLFATFPLENRTLPTGGRLSSKFPTPSLAVLWAPNAPHWVMGAPVKEPSPLNLGTSVQKDLECPVHIYIRKALAIMDLSVHTETEIR